jgi:hypothetical protein
MDVQYILSHVTGLQTTEPACYDIMRGGVVVQVKKSKIRSGGSARVCGPSRVFHFPITVACEGS